MTPRTRASQLRIPNVADIDFGRLRAGRLARLQAAMRRHELPGRFFNPANIRYATGTDVMGVWTAGTFARYCVVPAEGEPVLFEYKGSVHVTRGSSATCAPPSPGSTAASRAPTRRGSGRAR